MILYARYLNFTLRPTANGYQYFNQGRWEQLLPSGGRITGTKGPFGNMPSGHIADSRGRLWFKGTSASGFYTRHGSQWEATVIPPTQGVPFYLDQQGRYWTLYETGVALEKDGVVIEDCLLDRRNTDWQQGVTVQPGQSSLEITSTMSHSPQGKECL